MNYRRLGDAGVKLSEIGLGGWLTFGNAVDLEAGLKVMDKAFDVGINFFDTSNVYARGKCEEVWGQHSQGRRRDSYVLATKLFFPIGDGPNDRGLSPSISWSSVTPASGGCARSTSTFTSATDSIPKRRSRRPSGRWTI